MGIKTVMKAHETAEKIINTLEGNEDFTEKFGTACLEEIRENWQKDLTEIIFTTMKGRVMNETEHDHFFWSL